MVDLASVDLLSVAIIATGALLGVGTWMIIAGAIPRTASLSSAMGLVSSGMGATQLPGAVLLGEDDGKLERFALKAVQHWRLPVSSETLRRLGLQGRSVGEFYASKFTLALVGWSAPMIIALVATAGGLSLGMAPVLVCIGAAGLGYKWPNIELRRQATTVRRASEESLALFFDLITLERLANASAVQAVTVAASLPKGPLFDRIRNGLSQARLQQRPPWHDLRQLAEELQLPELSDLADILQLDEQGASLAESLQSRVRDLRNAQLTRDRISASERAESMTVWVVAPVMVFALIFLCPPLLRLAGGAS